MATTASTLALDGKKHTHGVDDFAIEEDSVTATEALTGTAGTIQPDDTAAEGAASSLARSDHRHAITAAAAGTIAPDDTAAEGAATSFARSDHRHAITAATAASLTRTATASEGVATSFARSDHVHATDQVAWGLIGTPFTSTGDNAHTADGTTDFTVTGPFLTTRNYEIVFHSRVDISAAGEWNINLHADGTAIELLFHVIALGAATEIRVDRTILYQPASQVTTLDVRVDEISGTSTLTFQGVATAGAIPQDSRYFYVKDIGPR